MKHGLGTPAADAARLLPSCGSCLRLRGPARCLGGAEAGVDQSTVSRRLAQVEFSMGGTLFKRSRQSLALTQLGREIFSRVERMEAALLEI